MLDAASWRPACTRARRGGVAAWRRGGVAAWRRGGVAAWRCGGVAAWRRGAFTHPHSRRMVNAFDLMVGEDRSVNRMVEDRSVNRMVMVQNHGLAKSLHAAAGSQFADLLAYKAAWAGRTCVAVNPAYTSPDCSQCGHRQPRSLSDRTYTCPWCGVVWYWTVIATPV